MTSYFGIERHVWSWVIGFIFALFACLVSAYTIYQHYLYNTVPTIRRWVIPVLIMVPVYAIDAFFGLAFKDATVYVDLGRECYESFAIYCFYQFLVAYLGGRAHLAILLSSKDTPTTPHLWPFNYCLPDWRMDSSFYLNTKRGVLQYIPILLLMAVLTFIFSFTGHYTSGLFTLTNAYPYISFITNLSQVIAMYCLVLFYNVLKDDLKDIRPLAKFLCIKAVVFFTFWQSVLVAGLEYVNVVSATTTYSEQEAGDSLQDFIICIEMFLAALAHWYAFPPREFENWQHPATIGIERVQVDQIGIKPDSTDLITIEQHQHPGESVAEAQREVHARQTHGDGAIVAVAVGEKDTPVKVKEVENSSSRRRPENSTNALTVNPMNVSLITSEVK